jgi:Glycosyl hydrolase family 47
MQNECMTHAFSLCTVLHAYIAQAIEMNCKTEAGYAAFNDVTNPGGGQTDSMESFFIAETLK